MTMSPGSRPTTGSGRRDQHGADGSQHDAEQDQRLAEVGQHFRTGLLRSFARFLAKMPPGVGGCNSSLGRALQKADLQQVRLVDVLQRVALLADRGCQRLDADGSAVELVDDRREERAVHGLEADVVDVEELERFAGHAATDDAVGAHVCEVADTTQQPVGDTRRASGAARDLRCAVAFERHREDPRRACKNFLEIDSL
jgi:hypothetical protein